MVRPELALPGTELAMDILGERHPVTVIRNRPTTRTTYGCAPEPKGTGSIRLIRKVSPAL
jgi:hypothetical protein